MVAATATAAAQVVVAMPGHVTACSTSLSKAADLLPV
jgi:hypothetical protein